MLRSLRSTWRSLRGRRRLDVLDVIAVPDPSGAASDDSAEVRR